MKNPIEYRETSLQDRGRIRGRKLKGTKVMVMHKGAGKKKYHWDRNRSRGGDSNQNRLGGGEKGILRGGS